MTGIQRKLRFGLLTGGLALLIAIRVGGPHWAQAHSMEILREQRLIDRCVPLVQALAPNVERQYLLVDSATPDYVCIASQDAGGNEIALITWDATREEVRQVIGHPAACDLAGEHEMSSPQLVWKTRSWLSSLDLAPNIRRWRPVGAPIALRSHHQVVRWAGEGRRASVEIDDRSGALYEALIRTQ
jgi:hypothetical protein